jgi:hypothetical protein
VRHLALLIGGFLGSLALSSRVVSAEPPYFATCGRIDALRIPTASAPGSIMIGGGTFAITVRDRIPQLPLIGTLGCLNQTVTTSGPVLELLGMPSHFCGRVMGLIEPIAGTRPAGIDILSPPTLRTVLLAAPGLQLPGPQVVLACFETGIDSIGRATAVRTLTASASPGITNLPSTSTGSAINAPAGASR